MFTHEGRNNDLFRVANLMVKGGAEKMGNIPSA